MKNFTNQFFFNKKALRFKVKVKILISIFTKLWKVPFDSLQSCRSVV